MLGAEEPKIEEGQRGSVSERRSLSPESAMWFAVSSERASGARPQELGLSPA